MGRSRRGADIDGVVLLDKPQGLSSNQALQRVRRAYRARKAGHTGSLDPLATGLLPICLGEATKLSAHLLAASKAYRVTARLGSETTTGDAEGQISKRSDQTAPEGEALCELLNRFVGAQSQVPPMYSALKVRGRPLYEYARAGQIVERAPRSIVVDAIAIIAVEDDTLTLDASVSGGTYVRTLVEDIARAWGGCAHVIALRRTRVGALGAEYPMTTLGALEDGPNAAAIRAEALRPISSLLEDWPVARLDTEQTRRMLQGQAIGGSWTPGGQLWRLQSPDDSLLGLGVSTTDGQLRPKRLFSRPQQ